MKTKRAMFLSWLGTLVATASLALAAPHGGRGHPSSAHSAPAARYGYSHYRWIGHGRPYYWRHFHGRFYFGYYGYPWYWGYPYPYYFPYGYYYPYGYYNPYNGGPVYDNGYSGATIVVDLQKQLAREGYYHGAIDGIVGPATRRAIRGYERDHGMPVDGQLTQRLLEQMDLR
jgi:Putative peptidoglycan binding domain